MSSYVIRTDSITEVDIDNIIDINYIVEAIKKERFLFRIKFKEKSSLAYFFFRYYDISFDNSLRGNRFSDVTGVEYIEWLTPFSDIEENFVGMFEYVCNQIKNNSNDGVAYCVGENGEKYSHTFFTVFVEEDKSISYEENLDNFYKEMVKAYEDLSTRF